MDRPRELSRKKNSRKGGGRFSEVASIRSSGCGEAKIAEHKRTGNATNNRGGKAAGIVTYVQPEVKRIEGGGTKVNGGVPQKKKKAYPLGMEQHVN